MATPRTKAELLRVTTERDRLLDLVERMADKMAAMSECLTRCTERRPLPSALLRRLAEQHPPAAEWHDDAAEGTLTIRVSDDEIQDATPLEHSRPELSCAFDPPEAAG